MITGEKSTNTGRVRDITRAIFDVVPPIESHALPIRWSRGAKLFQHPCRLERGYILNKLLDFHREHNSPMDAVLADLKAATDLLPKSAHAAEATQLLEVHRKTVRSRKQEPQQLGSLLVHVLMRLGVTTDPPTINSTSLEAPADESSVSDR